MVTVLHPRARLSVNGAAAIVDRTSDGGFSVIDLPSGEVRLERTSYDDVFDMLISPSAARVGLITQKGAQLEVIGPGAAKGTFAMPRQRPLAAALSDGGDRLALLVTDPATMVGRGAIELWTLPPGPSPAARVEVPVLDSGELTGDGAFDVLAYSTVATFGGGAHDGVFRRSGNGFAEVWGDGRPRRFVTAAFAGWIWGAAPEDLVGQRGDEAMVRLSTGARSRFRFSPHGDHLLVQRNEGLAGPHEVRMSYRLFSLASLTEVDRAALTVPYGDDAAYVVGPDLGLYKVRPDEHRRVAVQRIPWEREGGR